MTDKYKVVDLTEDRDPWIGLTQDVEGTFDTIAEAEVCYRDLLISGCCSLLAIIIEPEVKQ